MASCESFALVSGPSEDVFQLGLVMLCDCRNCEELNYKTSSSPTFDNSLRTSLYWKDRDFE